MSVQSRSIIITGAGGFLAGFAARAFREAGWRVDGIGRSDRFAQAPLYDSFVLAELSAGGALRTLIEQQRPAVVLHLAGPANVGASMADPAGDLERHLVPAARLFDAIRHAGTGTRVLLLSSAAVYGQSVTMPVAESSPLAPISPYGFHKRMQEMLCDEYLQMFGVPVCTARVFSTFGEGMRQLAVWEITRRALRGDMSINGTGDEMRDYLYAGDIARALVTIASRAAFRGEAINVASGRGTTIRELVTSIYRILGIDAEPRYSGTVAQGNPLQWTADVEALRALGFAPPDSLEESLPRTVRWIREQP
jgi:nucleoside-diphosphate-sugar epimerase